MEQKAFTFDANGLLREIRTQAGLFSIDAGESFHPQCIEYFDAVWDTGANNTAISSSVVRRLDLSPVSFVQVKTGSGEVLAGVYLLNLILPNNVIIPNVRATELSALSNCDVLIGMDVITQGDFAITHVNGKTCFSFRMPSFQRIDFVPESNKHNRRLISRVNKSKKNLSRKKRRK